MATVFGQQVGGIPRQQWPSSLKRVMDYLDFKTSASVTKLGTQAAITGLSIAEGGAHAFRETLFTFTAMPLVLVDNAGVIAYAGKKIYDFPAGNILIFGATLDVTMTKTSAGVDADWDGFHGVGTVTANNTATLTSTEQNVIPATAIAQATAGVGSAKGINAAAIAPLDGTATAIDLYLNALVADDDHDVTGTPANLNVTGTLRLLWCNLGDK